MKKKMHRSKSKDVAIAVTEKDYDSEIRAGVKPDETLKPGVYQGRRGGFLKRHPEALTEKTETKIGIYIKLDRNILQFFKERAKKPNAAPYQTQINNAFAHSLKAMMQMGTFPDCSIMRRSPLLPNASAGNVHREDQRDETPLKWTGSSARPKLDGLPSRSELLIGRILSRRR